MSKSFLEIFDGDVDAVLEADNVIFVGSILALLRQLFKICYDFASLLA
jgi:hypothetical protein